MADEGAPGGTLVAASCQTAGRGQRGNHWEADPGLNLTFSLLLRPSHIAPQQQFCISQAVSRALVEVLRRHLPSPSSVKVKWPNDIYVDDRKICGILIEHSLAPSAISHTIVGIGLNVNQPIFHSDAPNPVSMRQILGYDTPLRPLLQELAREILDIFQLIDTPGAATPRQELHHWFIANLWRGSGIWPWVTPDGTLFHASVADILPSGHLCLRLPDSSLRTFAFKEVSPLL